LREHHSQPLFVLSVSEPSRSGGGSSGIRGVHLKVDLNLIFVATERKIWFLQQFTHPRRVERLIVTHLWCMSNNFFTD